MRTIMLMMMAILIACVPSYAKAQDSDLLKDEPLKIAPVKIELLEIEIPPIRPVVKFGNCPRNTGNDLDCMACVIYYEARGESHKGQVAVAAVVMNRVKDSRFPSNVCDVVHQHGQFSWLNPRVRRGVKLNQDSWDNSVELANDVLVGEYKDPTDGALFFHANYVKPSLGKTREVVAVIGHHIFKR